jgi:hypothetical protein
MAEQHLSQAQYEYAKIATLRQLITLPEVQNFITISHIHQMKRLAAAGASAKTESPSLNLFSLLSPQMYKN